ncbi:hypothetical protein CP532_6631, partial [Ophiocordyceps camponoti-leonardi (nom. inval.)]
MTPIFTALPYKGMRKGTKADFAIMHERLAHAGTDKVVRHRYRRSDIRGNSCSFAKADQIVSRTSLARPARFLSIVFWDLIEYSP